ncbi:MAG: hypothetical protein MHM6MM_007517 [Cercozoa sp. M6MM]
MFLNLAMLALILPSLRLMSILGLVYSWARPSISTDPSHSLCYDECLVVAAAGLRGAVALSLGMLLGLDAGSGISERAVAQLRFYVAGAVLLSLLPGAAIADFAYRRLRRRLPPPDPSHAHVFARAMRELEHERMPQRARYFRADAVLGAANAASVERVVPNFVSCVWCDGTVLLRLRSDLPGALESAAAVPLTAVPNDPATDGVNDTIRDSVSDGAIGDGVVVTVAQWNDALRALSASLKRQYRRRLIASRASLATLLTALPLARVTDDTVTDDPLNQEWHRLQPFLHVQPHTHCRPCRRSTWKQVLHATTLVGAYIRSHQQVAEYVAADPATASLAPLLLRFVPNAIVCLRRIQREFPQESRQVTMALCSYATLHAKSEALREMQDLALLHKDDAQALLQCIHDTLFTLELLFEMGPKWLLWHRNPHLYGRGHTDSEGTPLRDLSGNRDADEEARMSLTLHSHQLDETTL